MSLIRVAYYEFNKEPRIVSIENELPAFQEFLKGPVRLRYIHDGVYMICNAEKHNFDYRSINRLCTLLGIQIYGNFFLCSSSYDGTSFESISKEQFNSIKEYFV